MAQAGPAPWPEPPQHSQQQNGAHGRRTSKSRASGDGDGHVEIVDSRENTMRVDPRSDSTEASSRLGSFMAADPKFGSVPDSDMSAAALDIRDGTPMVTVVWRNLQVRTRQGWHRQQVELVKSVSGHAEPRTMLAVVGPARSGKSALVAALARRLRRPAQVLGQVLINGKSQHHSRLKPTWITGSDELMSYVTVEQTLLHIARLQITDSGAGNVRSVVTDIVQQLGLVEDLHTMTQDLGAGSRRRVCVAQQLINCTPLLIMHDALFGVNEGDALAIMRTLQEHCKQGCTAIVEVQQPSTDICSFFSKAYVMCGGELVFFGSTGQDAVQLLTASGMPCPPLYSPVEQYMRLVDPTFEVYLQASQGEAESWSANFSGMMVKVLQDSYAGSAVHHQMQQRTEQLATMPELLELKRKRTPTRSLQFNLILTRMFRQSLRCFPVWLGRILAGVVLALVYGGTYWKPDMSFRGLEYRLSVYFLVSCAVPLLSLLALPAYARNQEAFLRESDTCTVCPYAFMASTVGVSVPYLVVEACLLAIVFIPMAGLHASGAAWGFFILCTFLALMVADAIILLAALLRRGAGNLYAALFLMFVQVFSCGYFFGDNRGLNLVLGTVSFNAYAYRGLVKSELTRRADWGCPAGRYIANALDPVLCPPISSTAAYAGLSQDFGVVLSSRWHAVYVLLGILVFWRACHASLLLWRIKAGF